MWEVCEIINIDDKWIKNVHRKTFKLVYWCWRRYNKWPTVLLINVSFPFFNKKAKKKVKDIFLQFLREMCCLKMFFHVRLFLLLAFLSFFSHLWHPKSEGMLNDLFTIARSWCGQRKFFYFIKKRKWHLKFLTSTHFFLDFL